MVPSAHFGDRIPLLYRILWIWLLAELAGVLIVPLIIPKTQYLSWYLGPHAITETERFLKGEGVLVPDMISGWRNRPNVAMGNWVIDERGSRPALQISAKGSKSSRILILGSSTVNGGMHVRNDQTISAYLEDDDVETLNFGTMVYSLDQCLLRYRHELHKYGAELVFVGIDSGSQEGLKNHYVPFRLPSEKNMPYLKPRFELSNDSLKLIPVQPGTLLADVARNTKLLAFLEKHDYFYHRFNEYCRMGLLPLAASCRFLYGKIFNLYNYFGLRKDREALLLALMREMVEVARGHGAHVVFVMLPQQRDIPGQGIRCLLPDVYSHMLQTVESNNFDVVDGRNVLLSLNEPISTLFHEDGIHYRPIANMAIADAFRVRVKARH